MSEEKENVQIPVLFCHYISLVFKFSTFTHTTFGSCRVQLCLFSDNFSLYIQKSFLWISPKSKLVFIVISIIFLLKVSSPFINNNNTEKNERVIQG